MSKYQVVVSKIVAKQLSVTQAAVKYEISRRHLHRLLARYHQGGLDALEPQSRRPKTNPAPTSEVVRARIVELRQLLANDGLDAGPSVDHQVVNPPGPAISGQSTQTPPSTSAE